MRSYLALLSFTAAVVATPMTTRSSFALANGQAAEALNSQFATLTPSSACTSGENACVQGQFATCANGAFVMTPCAGGLSCVALPLVNSPGTSITCDTTADEAARIAATGASKRSSFTAANGQAAEALNSQFATLTPSSSCTSGENACVQGQFATCVNGAFVMTPCAGGLSCVALPLVNSPGTSITCDTAADEAARIAATGASKRSSFALANGQQAEAQNAQFATLTSSSSCTSGENACVQGQFATCVNGAFEMTACAAGLQCVALPLVNSPGTSITCDTTADEAARIQNTGARRALW